MIQFRTREDRTDLARHIHALSVEEWGEQRSAFLIGRHPSMNDLLEKCTRFAAADSPVLITGETGTGKELFARALHLSSRHHRKAFLSVNCAQYSGGDIIASELFGHRKGSFTGATADRKGIFEEASGGCVFLDEVGELPLTAQAMLLRTLSEGEIIPVGETRARRIDVRIVAATSRDLQPMIEAGTFRADLYYRLRYLQLHVPPLRERGNDWELIAHHYLERLNERTGADKYLGEAALAHCRAHRWPGNVREVKSVVESGFHMARGPEIGVEDLEGAFAGEPAGRTTHRVAVADSLDRILSGDETFWEAVHQPFMDREMNRAEVRAVITHGLDVARGSYKRLLGVFGLADEEYLKFMDFLRHHRLKPER
jgi:DNA-binding NtrC family response regulator